MIRMMNMSSLSFPTPTSVCSAELVFVSLPANRTVVEGGDVSFTCSVTVNGNPDPVIWQLRGGEDNIDQRIISMLNIPGLQSVELTGPLRSPIILNNVSRSLDGLLVFCLGENQAGMIIEQPGPPAVLGVFCEFSEVLCNILSMPVPPR